MPSRLYRRNAENCLRLAELTECEKARFTLISIAHSWYELALEARRSEQRSEYASASAH
jgi:hypothetical protein